MEKYFSKSSKKSYFEVKSDGWFSIATYNVLFPAHNKIQRYLMNHEARYRHQINDIIPNLDADIIVLNEVTYYYYTLLTSK